METDTTWPLRMYWRRVDPKPPCGSIWKILVINEVRRIVLACDNGLYWSQIPPAPSAQGTYSWIDATPATIKAGASSSGSTSNTGIQAGAPFFGLAKGPGWTNGSEGTIAAARKGGEAPGAAMYSGSWSGGKLLFGSSNVDQGPETLVLPMGRTSLAACAADPKTMFAVASSESGHSMVGVWKSTDGGQNWIMVPMPPNPGDLGTTPMPSRSLPTAKSWLWAGPAAPGSPTMVGRHGIFYRAAATCTETSMHSHSTRRIRQRCISEATAGLPQPAALGQEAHRSSQATGIANCLICNSTMWTAARQRVAWWRVDCRTTVLCVCRLARTMAARDRLWL